MKKEENAPLKFGSLSEVHQAFGMPKPLHPLISLIDGSDEQLIVNRPAHGHVLNFYKISCKPKQSGKLKYGREYYDFDEGGLMFAAPNQIIGGNSENILPIVLYIHC